MPEPLRRIAVLTHFVAKTTDRTLRDLADEARRLGLELVVPADEADKHRLSGADGYRVVDDDELRAVDLCLVLGGDGTILRALGRMLGSGVPTTGVNFGNVGFLAGMHQVDWRTGLERITSGSYTVIELLTVEARWNGARQTAVNDIVLARVRSQRVLRLVYEVSGTRVGEMLCDGMIVASPAGSTAYNLSCAGPLVVWDADALVLNFIAPHSLGFRPLVLRPDHVIRVRNASPVDEAEVLADGSGVGRLCCGETVEISAGATRARLLVQEGGSFYHNVEEKLFNRARHAF
jgi:NAD+ kinase